MKKCPYCGKRDCIPEVAFTNCEMYGDNTFIVECPKCKNKLQVSLHRIVEVSKIAKATKKAELSW